MACTQALAGLLLIGFLMSAGGQSLHFPFASVFDSASAPGSTPASTGPELYSYDVIETYDHDPNAFTQGLDYDNINGQDAFWESTGISMLFSSGRGPNPCFELARLFVKSVLAMSSI